MSLRAVEIVLVRTTLSVMSGASARAQEWSLDVEKFGASELV
jgi:hypothetical protein